MNTPFILLSSVSERKENSAVAMQATASGYFSREECRQILSLSENLLQKEGVVGSEYKQSESRRSQVKFLHPATETRWIFQKLEMVLRNVNQSYNFNLLGFYEGVQIATYTMDGHYDWHTDLGSKSNSTRKLSISVQLSDSNDYTGGDLEFINLFDPSPREIGSVIVFPAYLVHRVTPVTKGIRKSMVSWVHGPPFR